MRKINLFNLSFKEVDECRQTKLVVIKKVRRNGKTKVKMISFPLDEIKLIKAMDFLDRIKDGFK